MIALTGGRHNSVEDTGRSWNFFLNDSDPEVDARFRFELLKLFVPLEAELLRICE